MDLVLKEPVHQIDEETAFKLFPEEVWAKILVNLEYTEDLLNVFNTFPELDMAVMWKHKRCEWLFEGVFPNLLPFLTKRQVLFFRRVCKQWRGTVDDFLDNHPSRRAYDPERQLTDQVWALEASPRNYITSLGFWLTNILTDRVMKKRVDDRHALSNEINPFVGRQCDISDWNRNNDGKVIFAFWMEVLNYLLKVGHHIWYLNIECTGQGEAVVPLFYPMVILNILQSVPNLKSLKLAVGKWTGGLGPLENGGIWSEVDGFLEENKAFFPLLPNLETLIMDTDDTGRLSMFVLNRYSTQIRKLITRMCYCRNGAFPQLPKLTELIIHDSYPSNPRTLQFLHSLDSPDLHYLDVTLVLPFRKQAAEVEETLLSCVEPFPRLENLRVHFKCKHYSFSSKGKIKRASPAPTFLPLKSISFTNHADTHLQNLRFLECFPSLEYIKTDSIRLLFWSKKDIKRSSLWQKLPKLRGVVEVKNEDTNYKEILYDRD